MQGVIEADTKATFLGLSKPPNNPFLQLTDTHQVGPESAAAVY